MKFRVVDLEYNNFGKFPNDSFIFVEKFNI